MTRAADSLAGSAHPARPRGGRPTRAAAALLRDQLLEVATSMLLEQGYGATSIESIAQRARVSKRTFYHRFPDKAALMTAVVVRLIDGLRPPAGVPIIEGAGLEQQLLRLAQLILEAALRPQALALHRLVVAEAQRFPDLAQALAQAGGRQEAVAMIAQLLRRQAGAAVLDEQQAEFAAQQFLQLVVSMPQLRALGVGAPLGEAERLAWARLSVALFLGGYAQVAAAHGHPGS